MAGRISYYGGIVKDNLVLDLDAAKIQSYPRTGTLWNDISGFQNNGTLTNGPTFSSDNGGSIVFDGANDYVDCGNGPSTMLTTNGTLSVWCKINTYTGTTPYWSIVGRGGEAGFDTNGYSIWYWNDFGRISGSIANRTPIERLSITNTFGTSSSVGNNITNFTMTWDMTSLKVFTNGVLISTKLYSFGAGDTTSTSFFVGKGPFNRYAPVNVYQTLVYNRTLSNAEVLQNYNATKGRYL